MSLCVYMGIITFLVNPFIETNERIPNIFNLYAEKNGEQADLVYILGSSQVREGINATVIQDLWRDNNSVLEVYNLGYSGDTPLRRLVELQALKDTAPKLVIIGVSYQSFHDDGNLPKEQLLVSSDRIRLDNTSRSLFRNEELQWMSPDSIQNQYEKRIWIIPAIKNLILKNHQNIEEGQNFKDPFIYTINETNDELQQKLRNYPDEQRLYTTFPNEINRQKIAFEYTLQELKKTDTKVIILVMPLNPLLEQTVNRSDYEEMREFLNSTNISWIDLESTENRSEFIDFVHMNVVGRENISRYLAEHITP